MQILQTLPNTFSFYSWYKHHKIATFREAREALLFAYKDGSIDDTEFALLYSLNSSENLEFPCRKYSRFDLDSMTDDECKGFAFLKTIFIYSGKFLTFQTYFKCVVEAFCISMSICRYGSSIRETSTTTLHDYKPNDGL